MFKYFRIAIFTLLCISFSATPCYSELYYFPAVSASTMGTCYASAPAGMEDITQQFFNPAVTAYFDDTQFATCGSVLFPRDNFDAANGLTFTDDPIRGVANPRNVSPHIGGGAGYGSIVLGEKLRLGIAITTPWRRRVTYAHDWVGRYYGTKLEMIGVNISPTLSYSIHDFCYFGFGAQFQNMSFHYEEAIDFGSIGQNLGIPGAVAGCQDGFLSVNANNWDYGWVAGFILKPCWYIRLGLGYRSAVCHDICFTPQFELGNIGKIINDVTGQFSRTCSADVNVNTPSSLWTGIHYYHNNCFEAMASICFRQWSGADNMTVKFGGDSLFNSVIAKPGWRDTVNISAGVKYFHPTREWYLRAGGMYQENPVKRDTQTPLLFGEASGTVSAGWGCQLCGCIFLDIAWSHTFPVEVDLDQNVTQNGNTFRGDLTGKIQSQADWASFSVIALY